MDSEFWKHMECLVAAAKIVIDRPKGSSHPRFQNISYPIDYGYLEGTKSSDGAGIDVWIGSESADEINGCMVTIDLQKMDSEIKIVLGCTGEEILMIKNFHNSNDMKAIFIPNKEK